jgi:hypothetical protein
MNMRYDGDQLSDSMWIPSPLAGPSNSHWPSIESFISAEPASSPARNSSIIPCDFSVELSSISGVGAEVLASVAAVARRIVDFK